MSQRCPIPNPDASGGRFLVQDMTSSDGTLIGSCERNYQVQLRASIDHPPNAAKNSIHFPKCSKSIDIYRCETRGLREQFFVGHEAPGIFFLSAEWPSCVQNVTQRKEKLAKRSSQKYALGSCSDLERSALSRAYGTSA